MPVLKVEVVRVAVVPAVFNVPLPMESPLSRKVTVIVGEAAALLPGGLIDTVAVKVTGCPDFVEVSDGATVVVVPAVPTDCVMGDDVLPLKVLSPP